MPEPKQLPPAFSRLLSSVGCRAIGSYVPCVLCQGGFNSIDHWLSFCPVVHLTWLALWVAPAPEITWRKAPSRSTGVALCYMLFHLRGLVTECGGLRPNILCVHNREVSHHVLDLWQRIYSSLPSVAFWLKASRLKLAAKAVELGGSRRLLKEKKFSPGRCA